VAGLMEAVDDPGQLARLTLPTLGRLLARRGDPRAADVTAEAWRVAQRGDVLLALAPAGMARIEWAWLSGDLGLAAEQVGLLLDRTASSGGARPRGALLRYLSRAGRPAEPFAGCPDEWAAGLSGDWQAAAAAWERIGDPYEQALELASSGEVAPTLQALETLNRLGAVPAARLVRQRLRELGVDSVPRGPQQATRANPSGLTSRQLDVLVLLVEGLTNAEIAKRLVLSTRTVDHHVSAILTKLGVATRQEAARIAAGTIVT
jgi:DNA-binding CsgD family transcriptional regulator